MKDATFRSVFYNELARLDRESIKVLLSHFEKHNRAETAPPVVDIRSKTLANDNFRHVLMTGVSAQLVMMSLLPGENIGMETHSDVDQIFYVVKGSGKCVLDGVDYYIGSGYTIFVKAGTEHDIIASATNGKKLKMFTIYSPPEHPPGTIKSTKPE